MVLKCRHKVRHVFVYKQPKAVYHDKERLTEHQMVEVKSNIPGFLVCEFIVHCVLLLLQLYSGLSWDG